MVSRCLANVQQARRIGQTQRGHSTRSPTDRLSGSAGNRVLAHENRLGLERLKRRGFAIDWFESEGWWQCAFMVWGDPLLITKLERTLGHIATRLQITHGRNVNIVI